MKQYFITVLGAFSALVLFALFMMVPLIAVIFMLGDIEFGGPGEPELPDRMVLELDLSDALLEAPAADPLATAFGAGRMSVPEVVSALERAGRDDRVRGLSVKLGLAPLRLAQAQELRDAVAGFRESGKFAIVYAQTFLVSAMSNYYLASAFGEIWLQETSELHAAGLAVASPFLQGTLAKLGLKPQFGQRHEYKNAVNTFTENSFTKPHREALERLLKSNFDVVTADIAADRDLPVATVRALIKSGPHAAQAALEHRLVDRLGYWDGALARIRAQAGEDAELVPLRRYLAGTGGAYAKGETIAVIFGNGNIVMGENGGGAGGMDLMAGDTIARAFREAAADDEVRAILFRVSSNGGSYLASDQILHELAAAREAGKPVIVSMGASAASGGYFVAMGADHILAQPGTITGSIGVFGGKMVASGLMDKLGISVDEISIGQNALINSSHREFTETEWAWLNLSLDRIYDDFTAKVGKARALTPKEVNSVARGRVWTGADALERNLIDELGGFGQAVARARQLAGLEKGAAVKLRRFPAPRSLRERLRLLLDGFGLRMGVGSPMEQRMLAILDAVGIGRDAIETGHATGVLSLPPFFEVN